MNHFPVRKDIRLKDYDYSSTGSYFITICVKDKHEMLGHIPVGAISNRPSPPEIELSEYGLIVNNAIQDIPAHYPIVSVDKYTIMPNHIHMILILQNA